MDSEIRRITSDPRATSTLVRPLVDNEEERARTAPTQRTEQKMLKVDGLINQIQAKAREMKEAAENAKKIQILHQVKNLLDELEQVDRKAIQEISVFDVNIEFGVHSRERLKRLSTSVHGSGIALDIPGKERDLSIEHNCFWNFLKSLWVYEDKTMMREVEETRGCTWDKLRWPKEETLATADLHEGLTASLRLCCNGARKWAVLGLIRMASILILFPFLMYQRASCKDEPEAIIATIVGHDWPLALIFWLIYMPSSFWLNMKAMSYFLKVQVNGLNEWGGTSLPIKFPIVLNIWPFNKGPSVHVCKQWFVAVMIFSIFARQFAYMWNAEVVGALMKTSSDDYCKNTTNPAGNIDQIWQDVTNDSFLFNATYSIGVDWWNGGYEKRTFADFLVPVYALTSLQLVFAVMAGIKVTKDDKCRGSRDYMCQALKYSTLYSWTGANDMSVFMLQADMACMDPCVDHQTAYTIKQLSMLVKKAKDWGVKEMQDYLHLIVSQLERIAFRFALVGLCQNVVTANIHASLFAVMYRSWKDYRFFMPLFPIPLEPIFLNMMMCFVGTIPSFFDLFQFFQFSDYAGKHLTPEEREIVHERLRSDTGTDLDVQRLKRRVRTLSRRFKLYIFIYAYLTFWTISKLFMVMFVCKDENHTGLYNFHWDPVLEGNLKDLCVPIRDQ